MLGKFSLDENTVRVDPTPPKDDSGAGSVANATRASASAAATEEIKRAPRRRRNAPDSQPDPSALQAEVERRVIAQLDELHDPKAWGALLALPANVAQTVTGKEHWKLGDDETQKLGITGAAAARTMMITNPRTLAFMMLGAALFSVYVPRAVQELKDMRVKQAEEKRRQELGGEKK